MKIEIAFLFNQRVTYYFRVRLRDVVQKVESYSIVSKTFTHEVTKTRFSVELECNTTSVDQTRDEQDVNDVRTFDICSIMHVSHRTNHHYFLLFIFISVLV